MRGGGKTVLKSDMESVVRSGGKRLLALALLGWLLAFAWPSAADIRTTKHNLAQRYGLDPALTDEKEVCVFCHFPAVVNRDGTRVALAAQPPQWQPSVQSDQPFQIFDDIGRVGLDGASPVGSQSVACLSCHDASQAFAVTNQARDHPFGVPYRGTPISADVVQAALQRARATGTPLREAEFIFDTTYRGFRPLFEGTVENRKIFWTSANNNSSRRGKNDGSVRRMHLLPRSAFVQRPVPAREQREQPALHELSHPVTGATTPDENVS